MLRNMVSHWGRSVGTPGKTRGQKIRPNIYTPFTHKLSARFSTANTDFSYLLRVAFYSSSTPRNNNNFSKYLFSN